MANQEQLQRLQQAVCKHGTGGDSLSLLSPSI